MSDFSVNVVSIRDVQVHDNAEKLEIAMIDGWACVVGKGQFRPGDVAIYIPVDSVLNETSEAVIFADSKIKLDKRRVRTIRIRGKVSQGMLVDLAKFPGLGRVKVGDDVAEKLGIIKYEPPVPEYQQGVPGVKKPKKKANPLFKEYTDINNIKHYWDIFEPGDMVVMTEKIHGTSARYACLPTAANTLWKRIKKFLGLLPAYEFCFGSRRVQLQNRPEHQGFYKVNVYEKAAKDYGFADKLKPGEELFGEIYGPGIQARYYYGVPEGQHYFVAYDVKVDGRWLDHEELVTFCQDRGIPMVPVLYVGPFSQAELEKATVGISVLDPKTAVREGTVVRPIHETVGTCGRVVLKSINPDYSLNKNNTDFH